MGEMDKVTQSNAAIAEESASASEELASQATQLSDMVKTFKLAITDGRSEYAGSSGLSSKDMNTLRALVQQESRKSTAVGPTSSAPKTVSAPRTSVNDTPESAIPFDDDFDEF
jgi:methyl-accepting chemotaxis protein